MYLEHFGLSVRPFEDRADPRFFALIGDAEEALSDIEYEIRRGRGIALLIGDSGVGKTLLIRVMLSRLNTSHDAVVVNLPSHGHADLVRETAKAFGVPIPSKLTEEGLTRRLKRNLIRRMQSGRRALLIVDQAEYLSPAASTPLMTLADLTNSGRRLLDVLVCGHERLLPLLQAPEMAAWSRRLAGPRRLRPFTSEQTHTYIRGRLARAEARAKDVFQPPAMDWIHQASGGVPRIINRLCDAALTAAFAAGERCVSKAMAEEAIAGVDGTVHSAQTTPGGISLDAEFAQRPTQEPRHKAIEEPVTADAPVWETARASRAVPAEWNPAALDERIQRLEAALCRADRMTVTMDASMAKFAALEKNLLAMKRSAQQIQQSSGQAMEAMQSATVEAKREAQKIQTVFLDAALRTCRTRLESQLEAHLARQNDAVETLAHSAEQRVAGLSDTTDAIHTRVSQLAAQIAGVAEQQRRLRDDTLRVSEQERLSSEAHPSGDAWTEGTVRGDEQARCVADASDATAGYARQQRPETNTPHDGREVSLLSASSILTEIGGAMERLRSFSELIEEGRQVVAAVSEHTQAARETAAQLSSGTQEADHRLNQMQDLLDTSRQMHDEVDAAVAHLDDKIGRLDSHHASASATLRQLAETVKGVQTCLKRAEEARHAVDAGARQAVERVDCLVRDVWSLASRTETAHKELAVETNRAEAVIERVSQTIPPAERLMGTIQAGTEAAGRQTTALQQQIERAEACASHVGALAERAEALKTSHAEVTSVLRDAQAVRDDLVRDLHVAGDRSAALGTAVGEAGELLGQLRSAEEAAQEDVNRLDAHLQTVGDVLHSAEPLLVALAERIEAAEHRLAAVHDRIARLEVEAQAATDKPRELVAAAEAQAARLDKVVTAVRKVFASLSQATLDARTCTAQCDAATRRTGDRLARLDARTDRAVTTLVQWIEEAIRAQQRLESALAAAPPIQRTHPIEAVRRTLDAVDVPTLARDALSAELRSAPASGSPRGDDARVVAASSVEGEKPAEVAGPRKAQAIARLIADARRAVDSV